MSKPIKDPGKAWIELKNVIGDTTINSILQQITEIDLATPWSESEPEWWLEMSNKQQAIYKLLRELRS